MHHYIAYGQALTSAFELEALQPGTPGQEPWLFVPGASAVSKAVEWYHTILEDDGVVARYGVEGEHRIIELAGLGAARISFESRTVEVCPPVPVAPETVSHFLLDQILPLCIAHTRRIVLHASCVARDELAIAFVGASGAGKSTLATALCRRGWRLVADDALVFASIDPPIVHHAYGSVRLWEPSWQILDADAREFPRVARGSEKRRIDLDPASARCALGRLYLLRSEESIAGHALRPAPFREAMIVLAGASFRLDTRSPGALAAEFESLTRLSASCPSSYLEIARGFDRLDALAELIESDVSRG